MELTKEQKKEILEAWNESNWTQIHSEEEWDVAFKFSFDVQDFERNYVTKSGWDKEGM